VGTDFDEWIRSSTTVRRTAPHVWESWAQGVRAEVDKVIELNREGKVRISLATMVRRLREHHQVRASETTLRRYAETVHRTRWNGEAIE
jgi:hypothetical protein